jgi:hypothetical protein
LVTSASLEQLSAICADKLGGACDGTEAFAHNGSRNLASFASDYQLQCDSGARLVGRNASGEPLISMREKRRLTAAPLESSEACGSL